MIKYNKINNADIIGILSSSICLIHCLATPLLIAFGVGFINNLGFKYLFLIISFLSVYKATEKINNTKIALLLYISFWGFLLSSLFEEDYDFLHYAEYIFAILIIIGHFINIKHCKKCSTLNKDEFLE